MGITSVPNPFSVDITEIDGFDNLHHAEDILKESMNSAAAVYGADRSWYLVNGSTCGILAAIAAAVSRGKILMARNSHKSAYHAVVLNQLEPVYLYPEEVPEFQIPGDRARAGGTSTLEHPEIRVVFVTLRPMRDRVGYPGIAATAHRHGAALIVDEAHGAHLPFGDGNYFPDGALQEGGPGDPESSQDASIPDTDGDSASEKPDSGCEEGGTVFIGLPEFQPVVYSDCVDGELRPVYGRKRSGEMARYGARLRELRKNWRS